MVLPASEGFTCDGPVVRGHWIDAGNLKPGYKLLNPDDTWAEVVSVVEQPATLDAWNLTVEVANSHFVAERDGVSPVWVHNACKFATNSKLIDHFQRHGGDFGAKSAAEYEAMAKSFLSGPLPKEVLEKVRPNGDVVRFDPRTDAFGTMRADGTIKTYYKPDPSITGVSNLDYFNLQ